MNNSGASNNLQPKHLQQSERDANNQLIRVLVIDDEQSIIDLIELGLRYEGFEVRSVQRGYAAIEVANVWSPQLVILDGNLPDLDGFNVCHRIRQQSDVLIIMLTVRDDLADKIKGLELGADDYLTKPFHFPELLARIRAALRRHLQSQSHILTAGAIALNSDTREVWRAGVPIELTRKEFNLLHLLMQHPDRVLERQTILDRVWGYDYYGDTTVIEVYISNLRNKLDRDPHGLIRTVRGIGYMLKVPSGQHLDAVAINSDT
ncbi:response regulator transcription factor [Chroococcidiopsis sp. CCNUC1]|uniref:response regulator transcription factor n=1 Tax=Chroococcidiopsis sp. CCNUC1 TaxID=2653189 RepID=UPI00201FBF5D|nr:response regulator transcription factor [Chroococcidiopsis sp. CCNUC1]URD51289.1 response regulator transcription factor [Chroococcidiopsis sp. CCNUC1]